MSLIEAKCVDQTLTLTISPLISSGDVETDRIRFDFCPMWDGYSMTAIFYRDKDKCYSALVDKDECIVTKEVLSEYTVPT